MSIYILAIESSCDDTSTSVSLNDKILSNVIFNQVIHEIYGGVVPELASREHTKRIIPTVDFALKNANINKKSLNAVAFTSGPGLMGSLMVGVSFAKAFAYALNLPIISVNHIHAHILANFINRDDNKKPNFPFLCLVVSGGHTQIVIMKNHLEFEIVGNTIDDAAGEAFDKAAKIMGLPYPGGPQIDILAKNGNPKAFKFPHPNVPNYDFSFSGLKTSFLYLIKDKLINDPQFLENNKNDLAASIQKAITDILISKLKQVSAKTGIKQIALAGGVSSNSYLRKELENEKDLAKWEIFIPPTEYCTDNAAMIAVTAYYKYLKNSFATFEIKPYARNDK